MRYILLFLTVAMLVGCAGGQYSKSPQVQDCGCYYVGGSGNYSDEVAVIVKEVLKETSCEVCQNDCIEKCEEFYVYAYYSFGKKAKLGSGTYKDYHAGAMTVTDHIGAAVAGLLHKVGGAIKNSTAGTNDKLEIKLEANGQKLAFEKEYSEEPNENELRESTIKEIRKRTYQLLTSTE